MMTLLDMQMLVLTMKKHCYNFARWAIEQGYSSEEEFNEEEFNEAFSDEFDDCTRDIAEELKMIMEEEFKGFMREIMEEQEEEYDED